MRKYAHGRFITQPYNINHNIFILGLDSEYPRYSSFICCPILPYLWLLKILFLWLLLLLHQCIIVAMRMTVGSGSVVAVRLCCKSSAMPRPHEPKNIFDRFCFAFLLHSHTHTCIPTQNIFRFAVFIRDSRTGESQPHPHPHLHPRSRFNWSRWCYLYKCLSFLFVRPVCISFFWQLKL